MGKLMKSIVREQSESSLDPEGLENRSEEHTSELQSR